MRDVPVGGLLELLLGTAHLVLAGLAVLGQLVQRVLGVPADAADADPGVLGLAAGNLDQVLAALLGELGNTTRITLPSLVGLTPRSLSRMAFSIAAEEPLSYGLMTAIRGSGTCSEDSWLSGVIAP